MEVRERGDIGFFFRPTVQPADLERTSRLGVQSFFLVLGTPMGHHRRVRIGRKRLPTASGERFWARVERVGSLQRVLGDQLESEHYRTKTRGDRYQAGARPIGHGSYAFVHHDDHTHLVYELEGHDLDAPDELAIAESGDYVVLFEAEPRRRATWTTRGEPSLLDSEGAELVLVGHNEGLAESALAHAVQPAG
jgi:hypothetical protein